MNNCHTYKLFAAYIKGCVDLLHGCLRACQFVLGKYHGLRSLDLVHSVLEQ